MPRDGYEQEEVTCDRDTDDAILCIVESEEVWVPKSCIHDDSEVYKKGTEGTLIVKLWWAEKKGWV